MSSAPPFESRRYERLLGAYTTGTPGPMVLVVAGVHGNEPAGLHAQRRVLSRLERERLPLQGKLVCIAGNLGALEQGRRFVSRDLNRRWLAGQIADLRRRDPTRDDDEDREQRDLLRLFDACVAEALGPILLVDLHTSSAAGPPFCCLGDTLPNRAIALALEMPVILGLEETIDGAILEYFNERGLAGVAVEGGKHDEPRTVDCLEAAIWLALIASGALPETACTDVQRMRSLLREASAGAPRVVDVRYHHKITSDDAFAMEPGYRSFQRVARGQLMARDRRGEIRARCAGRVLLPLYQGQGEDGFFLCRDVHPVWLVLARWMRQLQLDALLPLLPGVRRDPNEPDVLLVDPRVARVFVREIFHLLGYRHCRAAGSSLAFRRRRVAPLTRVLGRGESTPRRADVPGRAAPPP